MKILLIGNQNSGKTTVYNYLTKKHEKIGNWPGVTIYYKINKIKNTNHLLIDLPGIYSLSPYSKEEEITKKYLLSNNYDLIINVIDINLLERSLFLTLQLLELNKNILILLTHTNKYTKKEINNYIQILEKNLKIKVINIKDIKIFINILNTQNIINNNIKVNYNLNESLIIEKYQYIENITKNIKLHKNNNKLDKILLNKLLGIPIFITIMLFIYYLSINIIGNITNEFITNITNTINHKLIITLSKLHIYKWLIDLIINGIFKSLKVLITFIPQLLTIFILTEILNQTGYITRITYLLDGLLNKIGLSGKSIISFLTATSCSVPGIMQSRIIENKVKRNKTIFLVPFIPCQAKLPLIIFISNYLNINYLIIIIYLLSVIIILISSIILNKIYALKDSNYIIELPNYKLAKISHILKEVLNKVKDFLKRTTSIIFISSIIIWLLLNIKINVNENILFHIGKYLSFIFYPFLGNLNIVLSISIIEGLIAREQVLTTINILINNNISIFSKPTLISFLIFNMFSIPCINTIIAMKNELNSIKKLIFCLLFQFIIAFIISVIIYRIGLIIW